MRILYVVLLWAFAFPVCAKTTLTLEIAIDLGIKNSAYGYQQEADRAETLGEAVDSSKLENPELSYEYDDDRKSSLSLAQPLRPSDLTFSRSAFKEIAERQNIIQEKRDALQFKHFLTESYYDIFLLQQKLAYARENEAFVKKALRSLQNNLHQSGADRAEALLFQADSLALVNARMELEAEMSSAMIDYLSSLGIRGKVMYFSTPLPFVLPPKQNVMNALERQSTYLRVLKERRDAAEKIADITRQDSIYPTLAPFTEYNISDKKWSGGISMSIPLWQRQSGARKAAKARLKVAELELRQLSVEKFSQKAEILYDKAELYSKQSLKYDQEILSLYQKSLRQMEKDYLSGSSNVLSVWQAKEKLSEAQITSLETMQKALLAKHELELLLGTSLEDL